MNEERLRRVAAVVFVLVVAGWVTWALGSLNAADGRPAAVGPGEDGAFGGPTVGVETLGVGVVLIAASAVAAGWLARRVGRAPPT